jgi:hypothetical protein
MIEDHISNVIDTGMDMASHTTTTMSAHKPIYLTLKATPATRNYPTMEPPLPMELSIERTPDGLIDRNIDQWESHPSPELAERFLLQIEQQAAKAITKQSNDSHHMYRNKPHGWSPTQVVLYAQLVEIRRRLFGLTGRQQWRRSEVKPGIVDLIKHWRKQIRKYATHTEARLIQVSMTPDQLAQQPIEFFTRSTMDDMIHEVNSHLHYARRARLRAELNIMIRKREERFQAGKIKSVLNSVLKKEQNRFNYSKLSLANGTTATNPEQIQNDELTSRNGMTPNHLYPSLTTSTTTLTFGAIPNYNETF